MSFGIYMIGFFIFLVGLGILAYMMHVPPAWIGAGAVTLVGLGILLGVTSTRRPDSSN